jgi:flagellar hook-associated protein 3 FlgL
MISRVSTAGNYAIVLANLANAQSQQITAGNQVSSQKVAQDLAGYGGQAETLVAMQSVKAKVDGLSTQNAVLDSRYTDQDTALTQVGTAATNASTAIGTALATGNGDALMQSIQSAFSDAVAGLNTQSQGTYLFSGGQVNTAPVAASSMSDLTSASATADIGSIFKNGSYVASSQIDETSTVSGGMLASNLGTGLMSAFQDIQAYQDANGPFTGTLTDAQTTFLQGELTKFNAAGTSLTTATAQNGVVQKQIEDAGAALSDRSDALDGMIGNITNVNMADAVSRMQNAQSAVQASAQVFTSLQSSSLLNYLPVS